MFNQTASSSEAFVVGDQKVCILSILSLESFITLQQTLWNTNNGGKISMWIYSHVSEKCGEIMNMQLFYSMKLKKPSVYTLTALILF